MRAHSLKSPNFPSCPQEKHLAGAPSPNSTEPSSESSVPLSYNKTRIETTTSKGPNAPHSGQRFPPKQLTLGFSLNSSASIMSGPPYSESDRDHSAILQHT